VTGPSESEAGEFAAAFRSFLEWVHDEEANGGRRNEVVALLADFLGVEAAERSVVTRVLSAFEHVNLQTALDAWSREPGREVAVHGVTLPPHYGGVTLGQLPSGDGLPPLRLSAPPLVDLPNAPGSTLACLLRAVVLVTDERGQYVVMVNGPSEHDPRLQLEIAGLPVDEAQAVHVRLADLRSELNVYRGQVLDVIPTQMGVALEFGDVPATARGDVVLPEAVLTRVERHALGVATHQMRCFASASTSSADCCSTGRRGPARRTPCAT
jgi:hypothetical protein